MKFARSRALSVVLTTALCLLSVGPLAYIAGAGQKPPTSIVALAHEVSGRAAIDALGANLSKVANAHGKSTSELARALNNDRTLWVSTQGRLLYKEDALPVSVAAGAALATPAPWTDSSHPLADTFKLHSNPGSRRVIYLDFDGAVLSGTGWNGAYLPESFTAPSWDTDGNPISFGDSERAVIQKVWQRVSEDYASFDVDVTTEDPGEAAITRSSTGDDTFGMRVLISPISSYFGGPGGIAYVDVYDSVGSVYKPALVFPENLANGEKYIAEAASHECGHTLGLLHDGTTSGAEYYSGQGSGVTGWAPIMGNGYYRNVTQWSRGEYPLANNTEDDLAIINAGGAPHRADDYPDTAVGAPRLAAGTALSASGVIAKTGDRDVLSFSAGTGEVSVSVTSAPLGPDLDVLLELKDSDGVVVGTSDPADSLGAALTASVQAGTYYVSVSGTGVGDPLTSGYTGYASLGGWTLTGTVVDPGPNVSPVAAFTSSAMSGIAPVEILFDGSGSYDPDGSIASYSWDFGDGATASEMTASHMFAQAGNYHVTLSVMDSSGLQSTAAVDIAVETPNQAPTATFTSSTLSGTAPVTIEFDGSGSYDPDGSVSSWTWDFGDGTSGAGETVSHTYSMAGTYTASLAVIDDRGATGLAKATVTAVTPPLAAIHVASITITVAASRSGQNAKASVRIVDANGAPVQGVTVTGAWAGVVTGSSSAVTGADGVALLTSKSFKKSGSLTFTVTKVVKTGFLYDASQNVVTKASVALAASM